MHAYVIRIPQIDVRLVLRDDFLDFPRAAPSAFRDPSRPAPGRAAHRAWGFGSARGSTPFGGIFFELNTSSKISGSLFAAHPSLRRELKTSALQIGIKSREFKRPQIHPNAHVLPFVRDRFADQPRRFLRRSFKLEMKAHPVRPARITRGIEQSVPRAPDRNRIAPRSGRTPSDSAAAGSRRAAPVRASGIESASRGRWRTRAPAALRDATRIGSSRLNPM